MTNFNRNPTGIGGVKTGDPGRNPNGRPKLDKSLTNYLRKASARRVTLKDGKKISCNKLLAELLWDAVLTGRLVTLEGDEEKVSTKDRLSLAQWLFNRIDGMPRQALEVTQTPEKVVITSDEMALAVNELKEWEAAQTQNGKD